MTMTRKEWYEKWLPTFREALQELALEVDEPSTMAGRWVVEDEYGDGHTVGMWAFAVGQRSEEMLGRLSSGQRVQHVDSVDEIDDIGESTVNIVAGPEEEQ